MQLGKKVAIFHWEWGQNSTMQVWQINPWLNLMLPSQFSIHVRSFSRGEHRGLEHSNRESLATLREKF